MNKKASAQMWWIIIGAVIALVVMIILMVMFTGKSNKLEGGLMSCESKGGDCLSEDKCKQYEDYTISKAFECTENGTEIGQGPVCCFHSDKKGE